MIIFVHRMKSLHMRVNGDYLEHLVDTLPPLRRTSLRYSSSYSPSLHALLAAPAFVQRMTSFQLQATRMRAPMHPVSPDWANLTRLGLLFHQKSAATSAALIRMVEKAPNLQSLTLSLDNDAGLMPLLEARHSTLQDLHLPLCPLKKATLDSIVDRCTNLQSLSFDGSLLSPSTLTRLTSLPKLTDIQVTDINTQLDAAMVIRFLDACHALKLTSKTEEFEFSTGTANLLQWSKFAVPEVASLLRHPKMEKINFLGLDCKYHGDVLRLIPHFRHLETLVVSLNLRLFTPENIRLVLDLSNNRAKTVLTLSCPILPDLPGYRSLTIRVDRMTEPNTLSVTTSGPWHFGKVTSVLAELSHLPNTKVKLVSKDVAVGRSIAAALLAMPHTSEVQLSAPRVTVLALKTLLLSGRLTSLKIFSGTHNAMPWLAVENGEITTRRYATRYVNLVNAALFYWKASGRQP